MPSRFAPRGSDREIETGTQFSPKFDEQGLISCIVTDAGDGEVLMFAHMNEEALARTHRDGRRLVLVALAEGVVAERRKQRKYARRSGYAHRLRPGRHTS